ncbi:MAG: ABC transporter substrate-binding protein [Chloroflexi bacterium]|nr:ABC transporter substrate-binding protein [Chloroflexota bacterium]
MRRTAMWIAALALVAAVLAACNGDSGKDTARPTPSGPVAVTVWHSMPNPAGRSLQAIADQFNESQSVYVIELIFQGGYTDSLNKLINTASAANKPAVIQLSDASTQIMIDSGIITPIQAFIDEEGYDLSDFEPKALAYYTVDGTFYAMPFNLAGPILYYDRHAFERAGLDPDQPPRTLEEVREASRMLVESGAAEYGISLQTSAWFFEQMLAKSGALYANNGNGRDGRGTEAVFDSEEGIAIIQWWDEMVEEGLAYNAASDAIDAMLKLARGEAAMAIGSTALLRIAISFLGAANPTQYDTAAMPGPDGADGGIVLGGAAFWVLNERPEEEQYGAWEFLKFAASPERQAQWHSDTGYFPTRLSAYDLPAAAQAREEFPQFMTAIDQLRAAPDNRPTQGVLLAPLNAVRDRLVKAFELVLAGDADPASELRAAADDATEIIEEYNRTVQ